MKKTYINPTMKVIKLKQRSHLLQSSIRVGNSYNGSDDIQAHELELDDEEDW